VFRPIRPVGGCPSACTLSFVSNHQTNSTARTKRTQGVELKEPNGQNQTNPTARTSNPTHRKPNEPKESFYFNYLHFWSAGATVGSGGADRRDLVGDTS
jgi:hypothetical protein